jgi:hypothetical protein
MVTLPADTSAGKWSSGRGDADWPSTSGRQELLAIEVE